MCILRSALKNVVFALPAVICLAGSPVAAQEPPATRPATLAATAPAIDPTAFYFTDPKDGAFDVSGFLASKTGFLPVVMPITEPAVGFGLAAGIAYFHEKPTVRPGPPGAPSRLNLPTTTILAGGLTDNETWFGGLFHMGVWDQGRIRYLGGVGYGSVNLDWYGRDDAFNGNAVAYNNEMFGVFQRITFQLGDSDFHLGPQYRFLAANSSFDVEKGLGILPTEFESQTSGLGINLGYDTRDNPFAPTRGINANLSYMQNATWLGGDFDYYSVNGYALMFTPLARDWVLGVHLNATVSEGDVPFYDLPFILMRGIPAVRYVDNCVAQGELEIRWDATLRWSLIGFGGVGWAADSFGDLLDSDVRPAVGAGFRYLIAREYGIRMGLDVAWGEDGVTAYIGMGTGWVRP